MKKSNNDSLVQAEKEERETENVVFPYPFSRPSDMLALEPPEPIIEGLLYTNTNNLLFGASNAYKSFLGVDISCHIANGEDWHGNQTKQGGVVYIAGEGAYGIQRLRIPGWHKHHGIEFTDFVPITVVSVGVFLDVPKEQAAERLYKTGVAAFGRPACLYVFDVLKRSMKGSESDDIPVAAVIATLQDLLRKEYGAAILTLTHTGWADQTRARGHTDLWGSFDTRLKAEGNQETLTTILEVDRHKDAEGGHSWGFRLDETSVDADNNTLVPVLDGKVQTSGKKRKGPKIKEGGPQDVAFKALKEAIEKCGKTPPASNHIPTKVKAVKRETWDNYAESRFRALYDANVRASRMNSAITGLIGKHVQTWGVWCWIG
jgi:hypothetical protein